MITEIRGYSGPQLFRESLWKIRIHGEREETRNGPVLTIQTPTVLTLHNPMRRVLTDATRDANPFFHVMEFIWMMAGSRDIKWIARFNKNMMSFSDNGVIQHAAYGYRWRKHFEMDQIRKAILLLQKNPHDRRVVINMWSPVCDLGREGKDFPCNTQLMFRVINGHLNMTVINRSNDLIWGALGANLCHMTMLHELITSFAGLKLGDYIVFTNNLHMYESVPNFEYYTKHVPDQRDIYRSEAAPYPLVQSGETYDDFVADCEDLVSLPYTGSPSIRTKWMRYVGSEIYKVWLQRKLGRPYNTQAIKATDWRIACEEWISRRNTPVVDQCCHTDSGVVGGIPKQEIVAVGPIQSSALVGVDYPQPDVGADSAKPGVNDTLPSQPL